MTMELVKPEVTVDSPTESLVVHDSPLPVFTGEQMAQALGAYRMLQAALDRSMPEQIMQLDGKPFRKKGYWRAIAVAFKLTVEPTTEQRSEEGVFDDGRPNFGYVVTYRATAPNGRSTTGDGSCFAVEKARRFRCPHPQWQGSTRSLHWPHETCPDFDPAFQWRTQPAQATEHNVRSHAHTRAFNRAVSNLVGFGEVSAEEVDRESVPDPTPTPTAPASEAQAVPDRPTSCPAGYHLLTNYRKSGEWHKWTVPNYDAQGGALTVETKFVSTVAKAVNACEQQIPVKIDVQMKRGTKGEAYLNNVILMGDEAVL